MIPSLKVQVQGVGVVTADQLNTYTLCCNTVSDLRGFIGITGMQVYSRGYSSISDGGQGFYYWNASSPGPDNGTTIIVPSGAALGAWVAIPLSLNGTFYTAPYATAVARTVPSRLSDIVSVKDFGAVGNGVADDTSAIQKAVNAVQGTTCGLYLPAGTYLISSTLTVTGALSLYGASRFGTSITWASTSFEAINISTDNPCSFQGITFNAPGSSVSGGGIIVSSGNTQNSFSTFRDLTFNNCYNGITTGAASDWTIDNCYFSQFQNFGIYVLDTYNPDAGDSTIMACTLSTTASNAICIEQQNSGGLRVVNNKVLGGLYGYRFLASPTGASTVDAIISANSFENQTVASVSFERASGSNTFGNVVISANQIGNVPIGINMDSNAGWLSRIAITGNQITLAAGNGTCINLGAPSGFSVTGNDCVGQSGTTVGIAVGASATNGNIGINAYKTITTPVSNSSSTVFVSLPAPQTSTQAITCSTTYGSLYFGSTSITFGSQYAGNPQVFANPNLVNGGVAAWPSSITSSGFTLNCISVTSGGSGNALWSANGII